MSSVSLGCWTSEPPPTLGFTVAVPLLASVAISAMHSTGLSLLEENRG